MTSSPRFRSLTTAHDTMGWTHDEGQPIFNDKLEGTRHAMIHVNIADALLNLNFRKFPTKKLT